MKTLTVTEVARNFSAVMDGVESDQEEIVLVRNHKPIARLVPEPQAQNALEVLGDLYRTLDDHTADVDQGSSQCSLRLSERLFFETVTAALA